MLFGILVAYSEDYLTKSLLEFDKLLKLTARQYKLVVVLNNHDLVSKLDSLAVEKISFDWVLGSNQSHEFSGWNEGLDLIKKRYPHDYKESGYVFCNDTFCQHRTYTLFHRLIYSLGVNFALISSKPTIAGEVHYVGNDFEFNNVKFNFFISTYFFTLNQRAIKLMGFNLLPSSELVSQYLLGGYDERTFFSEAMDLTLKKHLLDNLFHGGWYKSEPLSKTNKDLFFSKTKSILAELNLSSKAHTNRLKFIDTYFLNKAIGKFFPQKLRDKIRTLLK